jgi:hypothetical protein
MKNQCRSRLSSHSSLSSHMSARALISSTGILSSAQRGYLESLRCILISAVPNPFMGVFERFVFLTSILEGQIPVWDANKRKALAKNSASTMPIVMRDELCRAAYLWCAQLSARLPVVKMRLFCTPVSLISKSAARGARVFCSGSAKPHRVELPELRKGIAS